MIALADRMPANRARCPKRRRVLQVDFAEGDLANGLDWIGIA